jgi:uncharacterized protein (DUF885 family)
MKRKLFAPLLALLAGASLLLLLPAIRTADASVQRRRAGRAPRTAPRTSAASHNARLGQIADAYLRGHYAFNPTEATALGLHDYDAQLESRSPEAVTKEVRRLRAALAELARVPAWLLSADARYDSLVLQSHARARLLELEEIQMWRRDPNVYNNLASSGIDNILKRNYAPIEERLDAVLARERQIARLLNEARLNLDSPPRIYTETAIGQTRGSVEFFTRVVPQMFERAGGGRLTAARRAEFDAANQQVIAALRSFAEWLERDLLPRSTGAFAIGAENYRKKLLYEEMIDAPLAQLARDGERELRRTQDEMRALAEEVAPGKGVAFALLQLGRERPTADGLVGETRAELDRIRAFVRAEGIITLPPRENLSVAETPEYARALSFASMDTPGAFERVATEAFYYVTPPDPSWSAQQREEHLSHYNRYSLPITSIHEAYPGHYYQLLAARAVPSRVRAALGAASFVEGWAHYCEQMMLDEGFGGNNPKLRLAQQSAALLRLCRYLVGIRLHTAGMSYEQAVEFFIREGWMTRTGAEREARRGTLDPTYLVYTLGKLEILKLREEWRARMGESFRLGDFHDRLLSYGMPPIRILRMAMLGDAAPAMTAARGASTEPPAAVPQTADESRPLDFSVLATGTLSGHQGRRGVELITDEAEWQRVWRLVGGGRPAPEINFNTQAAIVAFQGQKPTGGYSVEMVSVRRAGTVLAVRIMERRPASEDITTQVITSPFVAVSIPRPPAGASVRLDEVQGGAADEKSLNRQEIVKPRGQRRGRRTRRGP